MHSETQGKGIAADAPARHDSKSSGKANRDVLRLTTVMATEHVENENMANAKLIKKSRIFFALLKPIILTE